MKAGTKQCCTAVQSALWLVLLAGGAYAGWPGDRAVKCKPDAVKVGATCMDKYEASVWYIPSANPSGGSNKGLVKKVQNGKATLADLQAGGAVQRGVDTDDYTSFFFCSDDGAYCLSSVMNTMYAVSIAGVLPSSYVTWFQANAFCTASNKRLPTNAEWQAAASQLASSADSHCNVSSGMKANTGSHPSCYSPFGNSGASGAYDMTGNVKEWVADWVPLSTACPGWGGFTNDFQCFAGANTSSTGGPGALIRGGDFYNGTTSGPLAVDGGYEVSYSSNSIGFRCAR